jgi:ribonuclease E
MDKKILINASHPEEKRVAIVEGGRLMDFYVEVSSAGHLKGNIYKGKITALDRGLQAAFVDFGPEKHGFLPLREVMSANYSKKTKEKNPLIHDVLAKGQEIMVQVEHDQRGLKGAKLTNYISLPGRYLVMIPGEERVGISRKIEDTDVRDRLKEAFKGLKVPKGMGFILRTAGAERTTEELSGDLKYLTRLWNRITREAKKAPPPLMVYKEEDIAVRTVRDYLGADVTEVLVDDRETHRSVKNFLKMTMPWRSINVSMYKGKRPLFDEHRLEEQIALLGDRQVELSSGGSIAIDRTEALTAIDVNSAKAKGKNTDALALKTNLEAAEEVARQLRLRDIGGLIVIDFIDLEQRKGYQRIEERLRSALSLDKAHFDTTRISMFGLLEMSRERLRSAYYDSAKRSCPSCAGAGVVMSPELLAVSALRKMGSLAASGKLTELSCRLPVEAANYILNRLRESLFSLEKEHSLRITVVSDPALPPGEIAIEGMPEGSMLHEELSRQVDKGSSKSRKRPRKRKKKTSPAQGPGAGEAAEGEGTGEANAPAKINSASKKRRDRRKRSAKKKAGATTAVE